MALFTLGLKTPPALRADRPDDLPPGAGSFESASFDPPAWKPNYPNVAFANMQPEDAFWGARLVSRFSDEAIRAIVDGAGYDDEDAAAYLARTLSRRRDLIARAWLNGVNPIVDPQLSPGGELTFSNAAVVARAATEGTYAVAWARFDNDSGATGEVASVPVREPRATAPRGLMTGARFVLATIRGHHPDHPAWSRPAHLYFRNDGGRWTLVGLFR